MNTIKDYEDLRGWLALSFAEDIGPITAKKLLAAFHSPQDIFRASLRELQQVGDIKDSRARAIREFSSWDLVDNEIEKMEEAGVTALTFGDREYPESLRQIDDTPILLYMKGRIIDSDKYAVGIVGSRHMSLYGKEIAMNFASELASKGITVVSGMARGIDTTAHKGALKAGGRSIAVLGCGIDTVYPPENEQLMEQMSQKGAVISEFPLGTPPIRENFPKRNRLISGLSLGVLIVEAAAGSGSLITASYALEQGKDIFAVPGGITSINSVGSNALIKKGAKLVQNVDDIIVELAPLLKGLMKAGRHREAPDLPVNLPGLEINSEEKAICTALCSEPRHIDVLSRETGMAPQKLLGIMLGLELKGIVGQAEGKRFYIL
jgi:DNA processing protein